MPLVLFLNCSDQTRLIDTSVGGAGSGGAGGAQASSSSGPSSSSGGVTCKTAADCKSLDDTCNTGDCSGGLCVKTPANEAMPCDDGIFCTDGDSCIGGKCVAGGARACTPADSCTKGVCDEAKKACDFIPTNDGGACDDGDPCTDDGTCGAGTCMKGPPTDCSVFDDACGLGICDPMKGCVKQSTQPDGTACDDFLYCTVNDTCQAGACVGDVFPCPQPADPCMASACDEPTQSCVVAPGNDGAACDDNNDCTIGDKCGGGTCMAGAPGNAGAACDDHDGCTSGTTCAAGVCTNAISTITACTDGDSCCPPGCPADKDCLYWQPGVQQNVDPTVLTGWIPCYSGGYEVPLSDAQVDSILLSCSKAKLLMACRQTGAPVYQIAAMGLRADVLFDCGQAANCTHMGNGVGWYYSKGWSWGFVDGADPVDRNSCDVDQGPLRLCWHTDPGIGGYRCGDQTGLDVGWERVVYHAD